jgi:hypothetical protein
MSNNRDLITTSVSIPSDLIERARARAAASYRTFSQYVSYLIDQDLSQADADPGRKSNVQRPRESASP